MIKSPIHYMGNKYDLLETLKDYFPLKEECDTFIDLFGGSGCISINVDYKNIIYNEINNNVVNLLKIFKDYSSDEIINHIENRIKQFDLTKLSCDVRVKHYTEQLKEKGEKTYYNFRNFYNKSDKNILDLYTLTFFSFCNMMRFNSKNEFNMPFGNRCFIKENKQEIKNACELIKSKNITFRNDNAFNVLNEIQEPSKTFVYLDPPYSNTTAIYNEKRAFGGWEIEDDYKLFSELDRLNDLGIKWAMSNVLINKGKRNDHIKEWADKKGYKIIYLDKNYASLGKGNANSQEILVINYQPRFEQIDIFDLLEE